MVVVNNVWLLLSYGLCGSEWVVLKVVPRVGEGEQIIVNGHVYLSGWLSGCVCLGSTSSPDASIRFLTADKIKKLASMTSLPTWHGDGWLYF